MPPKPKGGGVKASAPEPQEPTPETVDERSRARFYQTNPVEKRVREVGLSGLAPAEKKTFVLSRLVQPVAQHKVPLTNKTEREFWKHVAKEALPARRLGDDYDWGKDRSGRPLGSYKLHELQQRSLQQAQLTALDILHRGFLAQRGLAQRRGTDVAPHDIEAEKARRRDMATRKRELYGQRMGSLAKDPEWDDVVPIPQDEPADALAKIAYPDDYAEAVSYLRAVMAADEYSPRCLGLTELVIDMNPAHYTVWLYRFKIVSTLKLPVPDEIEWLNEVALSNLKNYQIWHHRQLLMDYYYPMVSSDAEAVKRLAKSESGFIAEMLQEDTKNYHVWSYRQYLVGKLGMWTAMELGATQSMIEEDVRNNSAWSHRFFVVFSDPSVSTEGVAPTAHDARVPGWLVDREVAYAKEKICIAPQNKSGWNYLGGVLAKGGRDVAEAGAFAEQFVSGLGAADEAVRSSHALDLLAEVYRARGDADRARLCLRRLWERWDPVREGYWRHRAAELDEAAK